MKIMIYDRDNHENIVSIDNEEKFNIYLCRTKIADFIVLQRWQKNPNSYIGNIDSLAQSKQQDGVTIVSFSYNTTWPDFTWLPLYACHHVRTYINAGSALFPCRDVHRRQSRCLDWRLPFHAFRNFDVRFQANELEKYSIIQCSSHSEHARIVL